MATMNFDLKTAAMIAAALFGVFGAIWAAGTAYKWYVRGQNIRTSSPRICAVSLLLAVVMAVTSVFMPAMAPATMNADNGGLAINVDPNADVKMCGYATDDQLEAYFRGIYGDKYDEIRRTITEENFFPKNDNAKIEANKQYLKELGYGTEYPNGFRNGVLFPSEALKAEDYRNLANWSVKDLEDLYDAHRYDDVYYNALTNVRYADALLQNVEDLPEFKEQNDQYGWAERLRTAIDEYKRDGKSAHLVDENGDGTPDHYDDVLFYDLCRLCMTYENAVIRGIGTPTSTVNWELPSLGVEEIEDRWTVKLTQLADQEDLPAFLWSFPNTKSGKNAYTRAVNVADLRPEEVDPETPAKTPDVPTTPNPGPSTTPDPTTKYQTLYTFFRIKDTDTDIAQTTSKSVAVGAQYSTSAKDINGYTYVGNSLGNTNKTVTDKMPNDDVRIYFWYEENEPQLPDEDPIYFNITVQHWDEDTNKMLDSEVVRVKKGSSTTVSAREISGYVYDYNNCSIATDKYARSVEFKDVEASMMACFYYYRNYTLTTKFVEEGTNKVLHNDVYAQYRGNRNYTATALDITGYELVRNSVNGTKDKTVTGAMDFENRTVTFYYKAVAAQSYTVTTYHKVIGTNESLGDPVTQTVVAGQPYTTTKLNREGYTFKYTSGDAANGTMPNRNVTVTYWYAKDEAQQFNVTVNYVDEAGTNLTTPLSWKQAVGTHYATERKTFTGYTFKETRGDAASGTMPSKDVTVTYVYTKNAPQEYNVNVYYKVELDGMNQQLDSKTWKQAAGTAYTTEQKSFDGYVFLRVTGDPSTGKMPERDVTVTYWYMVKPVTPKEFTVTAAYVDEAGNNLTAPLSWKQAEGTSYATEQKSFTGYTFKETRGDATSGIMPSRDVRVTYVYSKNPDAPKEYNITVKYLVELDGMSPELGSVTWKQAEGTTYTTEQKSFDGYDFVHVTGDPSSGKMPGRDINVTYWYAVKPVAPKEFTVTAAYVDEAGNNLTAALSWKQAEGTTYTTDQKSFTGYDFKETRGDAASGTMPSRDVRVTYVYSKQPDAPKEYNITVTYQAEDTNIVLDTRSWKQAEGSYYETNRLPFEGYEFSKITGDSSKGTMPSRDVALTYWYKKGAEEPQMFTVTTQYRVVGDNSARLKSDDVQTVQAGKPYSTTQESFPGYSFSYTTGDPTSDTMPFHNVTVAYWYDKEAAKTYKVTVTHKEAESNNILGYDSWDQEVGTQYSTSGGTYQGYHFVGLENGSDAASGTMPSHSISVVYLYAFDVNEGDDKDPNANPGNNGTNNATEGIGEGEGEEEIYIPTIIVDTEEKKDDEDTSNHNPTDNPGQQAAGSDERQEVSEETTEGIVDDDEDTESSGNGGQDHQVTVEGADKVEGDVPPSKEDPANPGESTGNGDDGKNVDVDDSQHDESLDWEP